MDEIEEEPPTPPTPASPFWLSTRHTSSWNPLLNTGLHVALLSIVAIVLMVIVTPSLLSQGQQFFSPTSFKRGWGSVNILLVAFAIVCGFLRKKDDNTSNEDHNTSPQYSRSVQQYNWESGNVARVRSLRRASSSYPDLIRQEMIWDHEYDPRPRYYDDSYYVNQYRKSPSLVARSSNVEGFKPQKLNSFNQNGKDEVKVIAVDHSASVNAPNVSPQPNLPTSPPQPEARSRRQSESIGRRVSRRKLEVLEDQSPEPKLPPTSPPPPPPPPPPPSTRSRRAPRQEDDSIRRRIRRDGQGRRRSEIESEPQPESSSTFSREEYDRSGGDRTKREPQSAQPPTPPPPPPVFGTSQKSKEKVASIKKKKNRRGSHENLEDLIPTPSPPPPPPPPPPPSFFQNMFSSKKSKSSKKSPPRPPPPPRSRRPPTTTPSRFDQMIDQIGNQSPSYPIPPPPPPPPFKVPAWKFVVEGDYVKITGSPLRDESSEENSPLFFPSPDVNIKADDFIARFRAKLKLEKMNSVRRQHDQELLATRFSPSGPDSSPSPT